MKFTKQLFFISLVFLVSLIGLSITETASAASTSKSIKMNSNFAYGGTAYITTSEDHSNVYATYQAAKESYVYVKLTLQRNTNGSWTSLDTKSGYVTDDKNLNVTFSNISNVLNKSTRVKVQIYNGWSKSDLMQTAYSNTWTR